MIMSGQMPCNRGGGGGGTERERGRDKGREIKRERERERGECKRGEGDRKGRKGGEKDIYNKK